jgi:hypothetical protein
MNAATLQGKDNAVQPKLYMGSIGKNRRPFLSTRKVLLDERAVKHASPRAGIGKFSTCAEGKFQAANLKQKLRRRGKPQK